MEDSVDDVAPFVADWSHAALTWGSDIGDPWSYSWAMQLILCEALGFVNRSV
jgi:hypothetical protein